ncbi:MAG: phosphoribosyltransferase [Candidatus Thorarchaeota archaeon]|nr:phosphoribosyltransferase [Candidatus Thorarchaeota archaeon]
MILLNWSYQDRDHAGMVLANELRHIRLWSRPLVLAVPNGGVAVAVQIVKELDASLDLIIVRKLQIPQNTEAGFGALTSLGTMILNEVLVARIGLTETEIKLVRKQTLKQIEKRREAYHGLIGTENPENRDVILVDDGLASGFTMMAAIQSVKGFSPKSVTVAVPTSSGSAAQRVEPLVDHLVCPRVETGFVFAVANAYRNWYDVPDREVVDLLQAIQKRTNNRS